MANRMKEDEKNEKIIRGLLKLPENRRCINCNSLGPQYVCTNLWTFVCTTCSGIHREFTHRVKSISMAKFTSQEVSALQGGGNECAREVFFKEWDPQRHYLPDSSNVEKLRDFIKHVYVDKRYTGEKSIDRPPRVKMGGREEYGDNRRLNTYTGVSQSPPYEDKHERRYGDKNQRYSDERRSPGYDRDYRRTPARFEIVDDRRRDDGNRKEPQNSRHQDPRFSDGAPKPETASPIHQRERDLPSPPLVQPVRDILGEDVPPLRVGEPPKANGGRAADAFLHAQRTASSSSLGSTEGNSVELKRANSGSLIDFNVDPELPVVAAPTNDSFSGQTVNQLSANAPSSSGDRNWASFSFSGQDTAPSHAINKLESQLSQLSDLASGPIDPVVSGGGGGGVTTQFPTNASVILESALSQVSASPVQSVGHMSTLPMQQQPSPSPGANSGSTFLQFTSPELPNNQPWTSSVTQNAQGLFTFPPTGQPCQAPPKQFQETSVILPQPPAPAEEKPSGRKELPENLFASSYGPAPVPIQRWQSAPPYVMAYAMQYPTAMLQSIPAIIPQPSQSTNPFDLSVEPSPVQAPTFPAIPLQEALPNIAAPSPLLQTSSFGTLSPQWASPRSPYPSSVPAGAYMVPQATSGVSSFSHRGIGGYGNEGAAFGPFGGAPLPAAMYSQPSTPNSFSPLGGNPFG